MRKEKHTWVKKTQYIEPTEDNKNDANYHHILEYYECSKCGIRKLDGKIIILGSGLKE